jgi:hypothetical protein
VGRTPPGGRVELGLLAAGQTCRHRNPLSLSPAGLDASIVMRASW